MTPYQFGIKMAIKTAAAPQAMSLNEGPPVPPMTSGQKVEKHMSTRGPFAFANKPRMAAGVRGNASSPPLNRPPVLPPLNNEMLMGNNQPQYSASPAYNQSSNFMGVASAPIDDIDVGPMDYAGRPNPSALASMPSTKQLMSKVPVAPPPSPFSQFGQPARTAPAPVPQPAPADVAKF